MHSNNIIFIAIVVLITLVILSVIVNENFCNCLGTGVKYASGNPASYASYGGGGYKINYGWPVGMPYDSFARQMMSKHSCSSEEPSHKYSMVQSPEKSYKLVYNANRGPGRYGYSDGMKSYSFSGKHNSCGLPLLDSSPPSCLGPAGSFQSPSQMSDGCNLSVGVL